MSIRTQNGAARLGSIGFATVLMATTPWSTVWAVNPAVVEVGRQLFERQWSPGNPLLGSDGLGPLFNARSCVGCHHQGGVGGGGDARFNAKTIGIEQMRISARNPTGRVTNEVIGPVVRTFNPGFVGPTGQVTNNFPLAHHGGTAAFVQARNAVLNRLPAVFSDQGGPVDAAEVRRANATPILHSDQDKSYQLWVRARLFQRNTTALFGSGLIDQVKERDLDALVREQKRHPEISGRPATLSDFRYGKFGWRGNVATLLEFCDQACANEVGLETRRKRQSIDPTNRSYRNPNADITDDQIKAMATFVSLLPAPQREVPTDSWQRRDVARGERLFTAVGCAICHTPNVGPAQGLYSDLLLHDMGDELMDLNPADRYITRVTTTARASPKVAHRSNPRLTSGANRERTRAGTARRSNSTSYYGGTSSITTNAGGRHYRFVAPQRPTADRRLILLGSSQTGQLYLRVEYEATNFNQEWRTTPLWGLRDSAPYMHDGRAETVLEAVAMHDGESAGTRDRFLALSFDDREAVLAFLDTFVAPSNASRPSL